MNADERNFHNMVRSTLGVRVTHSTLAGSPPALVRAWDLLATLETQFNAARRREGEALDGLADQKDTLQRIAIQAVLPITGLVQAHASEIEDLALRARANYSFSDIEALPDLDSTNKCIELLALAEENKTILISDFGLTEQALEDADDLVGEFARLVGTPWQGIKRRKADGEEMELLAGKIRDLFKNRLDPLMRQFADTGTSAASVARRAFHTDYENARIIIDQPGADGNAKPADPTPEV